MSQKILITIKKKFRESQRSALCFQIWRMTQSIYTPWANLEHDLITPDFKKITSRDCPTCHSHQDSHPSPCEWSCREDIPAITLFSTSWLCDLQIYLAAAWERNSTTAEPDSASKVHCTSCTCDISLKQGLQEEVAIKFPFQSTKILHLLIKFQLGPRAIEQNTSLATAFCFTYCYWHAAITHSEKSQSLGDSNLG